MTDEEIIIDGVDVSKCGYFQSSCIPDYSGGYLYKNVCRNHGFYDCDKKPCAFKCIEYQKQLKHKEQALDEIEELAKHNNFLVRNPFCGTGYQDLSGQILGIIRKAKEQ